jgi:protocatechuate 3,4-dioxygenase beta subunit
MKVFLILLCPVFLFIINCKPDSLKTAGNENIKDTCDSPDADIECCFINMPGNVSNIMTIAGEDEAGTRILIKGKVLKGDGETPYPGILIYAYQTDANGIYSKKGDETGSQKWHGYLHGWCRTDAGGNYEIHTIRPGKYPSNDFPAHIHAAFKEPDGKTYYINDYVFADDEHVNNQYLRNLTYPGDNGVITLIKNKEGIFEGERITILE